MRRLGGATNHLDTMRGILAFVVFSCVAFSAAVSHADDTGASRVAPRAEPRAEADGRKIVGMMEWSAHGVAALLRDVRRSKDARAIACVNASLSEADTLTRRARDHLRELSNAMQRGDEASAVHFLAVLKEERAVQRDVTNEALACVGASAAPKGKDVVTVSVTIDKTLPPEQKD
jgi:hypothetical protein